MGPGRCLAKQHVSMRVVLFCPVSATLLWYAGGSCLVLTRKPWTMEMIKATIKWGLPEAMQQ